MSAILFFDILSIQVSIVLALILMVRRPPAIFWPWLLFVCVGSAIWSIAETAAQFYVSDLAEYSQWLLLLYTGLLLLVAGWVPFVLSFASHVRVPFKFDSGLLRLVLKIVPALLWVAVITNPLHGQFITPVLLGRNVYGPLWYVLSFYSYACLLSSVLLLVSLFFRLDKQGYKVQTGIVLAGCTIPLLMNFGFLASILPVETDITVVGLSLSSLMFVIAIYRFHLFTLSPFCFPQAA